MRKLLFIIPLLFSFSLKSDHSPYCMVYMEWIDIVATDSGWHTVEELNIWLETETDTVKQVGFIYKETKSYIVLIDSFITTDHVGAAIKIPKGNIIKIKRLK